MQKTLLHLACGPRRKDATTRGFSRDEWRELTVDPDPAFKPDHVAGLTDLSAVASASVDALFCSHALEQLAVHEVGRAFAEFCRVLKPDGFAVITGPDLQGVAELIAARLRSWTCGSSRPPSPSPTPSSATWRASTSRRPRPHRGRTRGGRRAAAGVAALDLE